MKKSIVVVDDEPNIGTSLKLILEREGYAVSIFHSVREFNENGLSGRSDAFLLDVRLPDGNGIDVLRGLRQSGIHTPVIMISGQSNISDAVEATHMGAFDFLEKPLSRDRVLLVLKNAVEQTSLRKENERFRELVGEGPRMIGASAAFAHAIEQAARVARSDARILLLGESGTGKELLASHIHRESPFAGGPFIKVNCAAIPTELIESELFGHEKGSFTGAAVARRGKFELAHGGTLFLDEVGDLHESSQAKLLRVLQEGEFQRVGGERTIRVHVRIVSATNRNLADMVTERRFREDLYYRLNVVPIQVPPLRDRPEDIPPLSEYFLEDFCSRNNFRPKKIDDDVLATLKAHSWPGNARELRNTIERMAILSPEDRLGMNYVPQEIRHPLNANAQRTLQGIRESAERERIFSALERTKWNVAAAARLLNIERTNLHKRMRALRIARGI